MHTSTFNKMVAFRQQYLSPFKGMPLNIIDLGSQDVNGCYRPIFDDPAWTYTGIDLAPGNNVDIVLDDPYKWSAIPTGSVDVIVSGQAFEHIEFFWLTMLEIARTLKPQGICCIIAPSSGPEHRYPVDCWRFYPDGMRALANFSKLDVLEANTEWEPKDYPDGSQDWKDSVLIASKPKVNVIQPELERDAQIAQLYYTVAERDGQIASLKQAVAERDGQIAAQIAGFNQAVAERDGQIAGLNQAVAERDGQIASFNQAVAGRDVQIASLNQAVAERDGQIRLITGSFSWKLTKPVRFVGRIVRN